MNNGNFSKENQDDPIICYLIVKESLGMSIGKTAAQCAHASQMLQLQFNNISNKISNEVLDLLEEPNWAQECPLYYIYSEWLASSFRKVVVRADDKEWIKLKEYFKDNMVLVIDNGLTEIPAQSETCIGLWPMIKSEVPKLVKRLQTLK